MKPIQFRKLLDQAEIRTYVQPFAAPWEVDSGTVLAYDQDGINVTSTLIDDVTTSATSVIFQTKPNAPTGVYNIIVRAVMENEDIVDVPGTLSIVTVA